MVVAGKRSRSAGALALLLSLGVVLGACTGDDGRPGAPGTDLALRTGRVAAGAACANGGLRVETGVDDDRDGLLDDAEVDATAYVCDGGDGEGVLATLELPGANCALGGVMLTTGAGAPTYLCNGATGAAGAAGQSVTATPEPAGTSCTFGGLRLQVGAGAPTYVCNGPPGADGQDGQSVAMTPEPPGPSCEHGGQRLQVGAEPPAYVCNGAPGQDGQDVTMTPEPPGANCLFGGVRLQVGAGTPGYVCNGAPSGTTRPTVVTAGVAEPRYTEAVVNGTVTDDGDELVLARGVTLATHATPSLHDTVRFAGSGSGDFAALCGGLLPATTYHVRAFATNALGTSYGEVLSFTTKALTVPTLATLPVANVTASSAVSGGDITDDGGTPVLARGVCWSTAPDPTLADRCAAEGDGGGRFVALATGLASETTYHLRAYATNAQGTAYGADLGFATGVLPLATVTTAAATGVSHTSATAGGTVSDDHGSPVTSRGICWSTAPGPTTASPHSTEAGGLGAFTASMTGLSAATTYHVRAYAVNGGGTSYGNEVSFTTLAPSAPSLSTKAVSGISSHIAGSGGVVTADGGAPITAKGVCYGLNPEPNFANPCTADGTGPASFNSTLTPLVALTRYYVRAYATNALGTAWGDELSFVTTDLVTPGPGVPVVGTASSAITGGTTASSGGYVSSDGGSVVTARGVCWSTSQNPTLLDTCSTDGGTGLGFFSSTVTGLSGCGVVYYVRAYATNATGTGYGNQNQVSTGLLPAVTTAAVSGLTTSGGDSGGTVTDDGGCPITQKGIVWSWDPTPTLGSFSTAVGPGAGAFASTITGLYGNRTHYVRAYATNNVGTAYGQQEVFTTLEPPTPYLGQSYAGGTVFHVDGTGHGLVAAPADQGSFPWGCDGTSIATSPALGAGPANTAAIVASCAEPGTAARVVDALVLNGYADWFLPSLDEIMAFHSNLVRQGLGNTPGGAEYLSSTEANAWAFWVVSRGAPDNHAMKWAYWYRVRAIRAF